MHSLQPGDLDLQLLDQQIAVVAQDGRRIGVAFGSLICCITAH
jgi:hypothetical protein